MCDTIVVVKPDRVLFAKNSDRDPNEAQVLDWQPARDHADGETLRCTWIEIPQVRHTHAVLLSRPFWMWGAEMGANEHGVVIGNEAVFTTEPKAATGLTGMDMLRLGLERSNSAEAAVSTLVRLLETHGQGGGCGHEKRSFTYHNSFIIADGREAFVLETAGHLWTVEAVSGARTISNGLTISPFVTAHSDRLYTWASRCRLRQARTTQLAERVVQPADLIQILRDHGEGRPEPHYGLMFGTMDAPCMHGGGMVAASQTTASWVADLSPQNQSHWVTGTAGPCVSLFKPVSVLEPLDLGPLATDKSDPHSLWWRHERFHRLVMQAPAELRTVYERERNAVEAEWLADPPPPAEAFARADALLEKWERAVHAKAATDHRPWWVRRYWQRRNQLAGLNWVGPAS